MGVIRRYSAGVVAGALLAGSLATFVAPGVASARCNGAGNELRSNFVYNGHERAAERANNGTCNGNSAYGGELADKKTDGYRVSVIFKGNSSDYRTAKITGSASGVPFTYRDPNSNSFAYEKLCMVQTESTARYKCGWGSSVGGHGSNHGF